MDDVDRVERENDVGRLRQMAVMLARENQRLVAKVIELTTKLATATGQDRAQLELELAELHTALSKGVAEGPTKPKNEGRGGKGAAKDDGEPQKGHGPKAQPKLEEQVELWTLDEADKTCPSCGGDLAVWEGQTDDSEEIDVIERRFVIRRHKRQKYRCGCGHCETALGPKRWFARGRYSANFVILLAVGKYLDHMPLERMCRQMARDGLHIDSNTMFDQLWELQTIVRPAYERLAEIQRSRPYLHIDETSWPMLDGSKNWQMWDVVSDVAAYYVIRDGRDAEKARELLGGYEGYIITDGYVVYESVAKQFPNLKHCGCLVHARRKFVECSAAFPKETERILDLFGALYEIEKRATTLEDRRVLRDTESRAVSAALQRALIESATTPGDALDRAIRYMAKRWSKLMRFLDDPRIPLDNNAAERALRGPVVGRKNHYGSKSRRGTEVAAVFYSLLESAKLARVAPNAYLRRCVDAHLAGEQIPLPHEVALDPA